MPVCIDNESAQFTNRYGIANYILSIKRTYNLKNYATRNAAEAALIADPSCPVIDLDYTILVRGNYTVEAIPESQNNRDWTADVTWNRWVPEEIGDEIISGSISSQSIKVRHAITHVASYHNAAGPSKPSSNHPTFGMVNVTPDGVEGADIDFPVLNFSIRKSYTKGSIATLPTLVTLHDYAHKPNNAIWRGFGIGTVKLIGADVSNEGDNEDIITYNFAASPTVTGLVISSPFGNITVPSKLGWQYLWISYEDFHDDTSGWSYSAAVAAHVEEMQPGADLNVILP